MIAKRSRVPLPAPEFIIAAVVITTVIERILNPHGLSSPAHPRSPVRADATIRYPFQRKSLQRRAVADLEFRAEP